MNNPPFDSGLDRTQRRGAARRAGPRRRIVRLLAAGALSTCAVAAADPARTPSHTTTRAASATASVDTRDGRALYEYYCYQCHGYAGNGDTLAAQFLQPPPRDFTRLKRGQRTREAMLHSVRHGRPGTGMKSFSRVLDETQRAAVVDYIRANFMDGGKVRTGYHTPANGWPDHPRHAAAFPFATGALTLDARDLSPAQEAGKRLFLSACVTCHEGRMQSPAPVWAERVVSYPRNPGTCTPCHANVMRVTQPADAVHARTSAASSLTPMQLRGRQLFVTHCAFCHAEDGSGRNWIGTFLEPHARDLTQSALRVRLTPARLRRTILEGLPGTAMPAWKTVLGDGDVDALMDFLSVRHQWPRAGGTSSTARSADDGAREPAPQLSWRKRAP